jgi:hypothetical protein
MKPRLILAILAVAVCSFTRPASAQPPGYADPFLDHLIGTWVLRGQSLARTRPTML